MTSFRAFVIALAVGAAASVAPAIAQSATDPDLPVLADFARRVQAYVDLKNAAATAVLPLVPLRDPAEIRRRTEALATVIRSARWYGRQGDLFTPEVAQLVRRAIRTGCEGDYARLLALTREELTAPLPEPVVHGSWPSGAPVPMMLPGMLAALPPLPDSLRYRFMNRALVVLDIDANLIVDFVPDAIPITTESNDAH